MGGRKYNHRKDFGNKNKRTEMVHNVDLIEHCRNSVNPEFVDSRITPHLTPKDLRKNVRYFLTSAFHEFPSSR